MLINLNLKGGCSRMSTYGWFWGNLTSKVGHHADRPSFGFVIMSSLIGLRTWDYKSLCVAVMICSTVVNIRHRHTQTHTHTDRQHVDQTV